MKNLQDGRPEERPGLLFLNHEERRIRSVCSPLRRAPLLATPIATPLQGGRPERPGLFFLKKLLRIARRPPASGRKAGKTTSIVPSVVSSRGSRIAI